MWKHDHIDAIRQKLLAKNIIDLSGYVDEDMAMYVRDALMILATKNNPDIRVIITSEGGNLSVGLDIYDMLRNYSGQVIGEVQSFARSTAAVILQACDRRVAMRNSKIMIHNVNVRELSLNVFSNSKMLSRAHQKLEKDQLNINTIYSLKSGKSVRAIAKVSNRDKDLTAQEALDFGLIDEII